MAPALRLRRASSPTPPTAEAHAPPQETWLACDRREAVVARASLWWNETARLDGQRCGYIGGYRAGSRSAARALLRHACARLREAGCAIAVGPIDGSTWHGYRLVTGGAKRPAFFLEPQNPAAWVGDMAAAGFSPVATYHSRLTTRLTYEDPALPGIERRLARAGVGLRRLDPARLNEELRDIYGLAHACFSDHLLYTRIPERSFEATYRALARRGGHRHVVLAERGRRLVGFAFAIPDHAQAQRGAPIDTLVLKTMAVAPGRAFAGLGRLLFHEINREARTCGFRAVIHALMHDANASAAYSRRFAEVIRRYALFAKALT